MVSGATIRRNFRRTRVTTACAVCLFALAAIFISAEWWRQRAEQQLENKAAETLAVQAEALSGILDKYRLLPPLLSREKSVVALFDDMGADTSDAARQKAIEIAGMSGAKEVAFLYPDGRVLATAGGLFSENAEEHRKLLEAVRQGRLGRQAISLDSEQRAYAFAFGVRKDSKLIGAIAVYVDFDPVEATWSLSTNPIFVTDQTGTVFLTNRPLWRLRPLSDLMADAAAPDHYLVGGNVLHSDLTRHLPLLDWQLHVLSDERPLVTAAWIGGIIAGLVSLLFGAVAFIVVQRREAQLLRMRRDRASALRLERLVRERTKALSETNISLSREIDERRLTEEQLRKTQAELVQATKLAALGQMSAALSHEFNQPLAAIRTYSDNAHRFLERGKTDNVSDNLTRISGLVDRMARLSRSLLSFSRKPGTAIKPVPLAPVLDEALMLVRPRAKKAGVALETEIHGGPYYVLGGQIRLSQVFVNLINNAVDALAGQENGKVLITVGAQGDGVIVRVEDNGPGIPEDQRGSVFEPFFTTKDVGAGIGIGLSIASSIVRDFGGTIELEEAAGGGACFSVCLRAADASDIAAE
ncbi:sensor histidine kinase [Hoeflea sp. TYP-13]|uniref:sensor histidine kinase n=1 Tax=Hoeflea sp. TYP-13 TaxID=3230023 RepID=UPI0034C610DB